MKNLFANVRGDITGGITAGVVALPLALALGVASGVGPMAGMYGAIAVGFFAALFGGTPSQISGPTGPMVVVLAGLFASLSGNIELSIFDIKGRKIRKLVNEQKPVGDYQIKWDGTNDSGAPLSSGQYFYQLKVGYFTSTKKMVLLK